MCFWVVPFSSLGALRLGFLPPPVSLAAVGISSVAVPNQPLVGGTLPDGPHSALPLFSSELSGFVLIPARIVQQIRAARCIDMRDLHNDNVAVRRHFEDFTVRWGCK